MGEDNFWENLCGLYPLSLSRAAVFHAPKHSGASIMDNNSGVPLGSIQRILGHEHRKTTEIYLHSFGEAERQAVYVYEKAKKKSQTESRTE